MNAAMIETSPAQLGWRFGIGVALIVAGYVVLALIPVVANSELTLGIRTALTGLFAIAPFATKIAAVAVMGKAGFILVKSYVSKFFGGFWPDHVSRSRYRFGVALFVLSIIYNSVLPYLPGYFIDWKSNAIFWSLVGDAGVIASLFIVGGEFWNKVMALFSYDAKIAPPADGSASGRPR